METEVREERKKKGASKYLSIFKFSSSLKMLKVFHQEMSYISEFRLENQIHFCFFSDVKSLIKAQDTLTVSLRKQEKAKGA